MEQQIEETDALLHALANPSAQLDHAAHHALSARLKHPAFAQLLLHRLAHAADQNLRHLAAVLLKRRLGGHWPKLDDATRHAFKTTLLSHLRAEVAPAVRRATADLLAVVARFALPATAGGWPELLELVSSCAASEHEQWRSLSVLLIEALLHSEDVADELRPHFESLAALLGRALAEPPPSAVPRGALAAVAAWAGALDERDQARLLRPLVPSVIAVAHAAVALADDETLLVAASLLDDLVRASALSVSHTVPVCELALSATNAAGLEAGSHSAALMLVASLIVTRRKLLVKQQMLAPVFARLVDVCGDDEEEGAGADDADEASPVRHACEVLELLAEEVSSRHMMPLVLERLRTHGIEATAAARAATLNMVAATCHGLSEAYGEVISDMIALVVASMRDGHLKVRGAACLALAQLAQAIYPEILEHHTTVLPCLLEVSHQCPPLSTA